LRIWKEEKEEEEEENNGSKEEEEEDEISHWLGRDFFSSMKKSVILILESFF
jgi:hypothetical protein